MARTQKLARQVSHELVKELIASLGENRARKILAVDETRFKYLASGHGCIGHDQLARVDRYSGRAWQRWVVDAGRRHAKTAESKAAVGKAYQMWDRILGPEKLPQTRSLARKSHAVLQPAV